MTPHQIRRIAASLTHRFEHRYERDLFNDTPPGLSPQEQCLAEQHWQRMIHEGHIDRFNQKEGASRKAKFGCSKEKRYDCRLLVLALCVNKEGFIRYSSILEGNAADPQSLPAMAVKLAAKSPSSRHNTLVVIDAGISTEENLAVLKAKGFNYLCVSRTRLKDYELNPNQAYVVVRDTRNQPITLRQVQSAPGEDHYLEISYWKEIVRRLSTQKLVTTEAVNALGEKVKWRQCSRPSPQAKGIYQALNYKEVPFIKRKICRSQLQT